MRFATLAYAGIAATLALPAAAQTIKIAYIDPLSGGGAAVGEIGLKTFNFVVADLNDKGGANGKKLEIVAFDNKANPQETIVQAQKAIDQGIRIITLGNGSSNAAALSDFVAKHNDRNPGKTVVYLNYAAVDPILTNDKCHFWHFRFDSHSDIKMAALTTMMKGRDSIKKLYLINQDYSFGQAVRQEARKQLKEKRPDIQIVGDELHPLLKINDFAPYVTKIKASGADSVLTANWGQDMALLLKAAADAGLPVDWYTFHAGGTGGPTGIKQAGLANRVFQVGEGFANVRREPSQKVEEAFRAKSGGHAFTIPRIHNQMHMLTKAINEAKSEDPKAFAPRLSSMKIEVLHGGEGYMRAEDHQFFQPMYIATFGPLKPGDKFDEESTGWGWTDIINIDLKDTVLPTTCKMNKPS